MSEFGNEITCENCGFVFIALDDEDTKTDQYDVSDRICDNCGCHN